MTLVNYFKKCIFHLGFLFQVLRDIFLNSNDKQVWYINILVSPMEWSFRFSNYDLLPDVV
jgi:hypothetical protein